jgi:mannose-6-phosphate isomerase-like protein (cupin superfamily)
VLRNHRANASARSEQGGGEGVDVVWAFRGGDFQTRFDSVGRVSIPPRARFGPDSSDELEWCVVPLSGTLRFQGRTEEFDLPPRAVVLTTFDQGDSALVNKSSDPAEALLATVEVGEDRDGRRSGANTRTSRLDRSLLSPFEAHLGLGRIQFRSLFDRRSSAWNSIDHVLLPHGTSVGQHRNHNVEEVFVILEGRGTMKIEKDVVSVAEGDCIFNPLGGAHGIINPHGAALEFLNLSVPAGEDPAEVTDLDDSLTDLMEG